MYFWCIRDYIWFAPRLYHSFKFYFHSSPFLMPYLHCQCACSTLVPCSHQFCIYICKWAVSLSSVKCVQFSGCNQVMWPHGGSPYGWLDLDGVFACMHERSLSVHQLNLVQFSHKMPINCNSHSPFVFMACSHTHTDEWMCAHCAPDGVVLEWLSASFDAHTQVMGLLWSACVRTYSPPPNACLCAFICG